MILLSCTLILPTSFTSLLRLRLSRNTYTMLYLTRNYPLLSSYTISTLRSSAVLNTILWLVGVKLCVLADYLELMVRHWRK